MLPHFPAVRNTANHYAFMGILRDLYGITDRTLTGENWQLADEMVRSHAGDPGWVRTVLDRARAERVIFPTQDGPPDPSPRYVPYESAEYLFSLRTPEQLRAIAGVGFRKKKISGSLALPRRLAA